MQPSPAPETLPRRNWLADLCFVGVILVLMGVFLLWLWSDRSLDGPETLAETPVDASISETVDDLEAAFQAEWTDKGLEPMPESDSWQVLRRLSLALTGTIPSLQEIRALENVPEAERIDWWLTHLLADQRSGDYLGERMARTFVGTEGGPFIVYRRRRMVNWLSEQFMMNRPYDQLVGHLISADGLWTSDPAANFITVTIDQDAAAEEKGPDEVKLAARMTRAFLGLRIDCVECHDDMFGDRWKQEDFHQLAAFFAGTENTLTGLRDKEDTVYAVRYNNQATETEAPRKVPFLEELLPVEGGSRERLAAWVTHPENRPFARTAINRIWAIMFGRPLMEPIDSIPLEGPWHPAMEVLADDFVQHGYDLHRTIRIIALSSVFQMDSRSDHPDVVVTEDHEQHWAAFPLVRLRPEQVAGSLIQASSLTTIDADAHILQRIRRFGETQDFISRYGDPGEGEFTDPGGSIPQRLLLMNGELMEERTKNNVIMNASHRIGAVSGSARKAIETAYQVILTRQPTEAERGYFVAQLSGKKNAEMANAMQDIYWSLLNSTEFSWNH